jgi:hypothetical protein
LAKAYGVPRRPRRQRQHFEDDTAIERGLYGHMEMRVRARGKRTLDHQLIAERTLQGGRRRRGDVQPRELL